MYQITNLTEKQIQIIQDALELYFRVQIGQLHQVAWVSLETLGDQFPDFRDDLNKLEQQYKLRENKLQGNSAIACDIHQVIRHRLSWDREPKGGWTVNFDEPLQVGKEELCKVSKVE